MNTLTVKHNKFLISNFADSIPELLSYKNNFIISQKIKDENDLEKITDLSNYAVYIKYLKCEYLNNNIIEINEIKKLQNNIYDSI